MLHFMQISTSVLWTLTFAPTGSVRTCEAATAVTAIAAMSQMLLEETASVSSCGYVSKSHSGHLLPWIRGETIINDEN